MAAGVIDVSICICTYRRPTGLTRLLRSLRNLDAGSPSHEVIVVDNDAAGSAEPVAERARNEGMRLRYVVEPVRGIARARNRSVRAATGTYVAFIDDDEEADPQWLLQLWREVQRNGATAGVGPVLPRFGDGGREWLVAGGFFERQRIPTGTVIDAKRTRTGNAIVERRRLVALSGPFDERFDLTGGEDGDLFARLIDNGACVIAVDSAIVYEHLPARRATMRWLLQRRVRTSIDAARLEDHEAPVQSSRLRSSRALVRAALCAIFGVVIFPISRADGLHFLLLAADRLGRFLFLNGISLRPYARRSWR